MAAKKDTAQTATPRDSGIFRIVNMVKVGKHRYRITTISKKYGEVTQEVICLPESVFEDDLPPEHHEGCRLVES